MRILVTGATGFVGRWLMEDLADVGHDPVAAPTSAALDVTDMTAVSALVATTRPDAIVHLAGVSYAPDAARDLGRALAVNEGGTRSVIRAARQRSVPVLVSGSSEVYGRPLEGVLPLTEASPLRADQPYGLSKRAQEIAALEEGAAGEVPVVVTRSFNHTGPGQRESFVAPALARRVVDAKRRGLREISVGNLDVKRDIGDVRDVVRAYRLLVEGLAAGHVPGGTVVNVATGRAVAIRDLLDLIVRAAGAEVVPKVDAELVRPGEAPLIVGDASRLRALTGWEPTIPLERTVSDLVVSIEAG